MNLWWGIGHIMEEIENKSEIIYLANKYKFQNNKYQLDGQYNLQISLIRYLKYNIANSKKA